MDDVAALTVDGGLAEIVLNRPDKLNALDEAGARVVRDRLAEAAAAGVRALVLRGEGRGFCAGRDLSTSQPLDEDGEAILRDHFNPLFADLAAFPAPTFAAVHGAALGVGLGLALACDVTYVADDARIGSPFARIGAVLDSGAHHFLVARIGAHRTLELVYTGRLLSGAEAAAWGIVNRALPAADLVATVRAMAVTTAAGPTQAFLASKRIVGRIANGDAPTLDAVLAAEAAAQGAASRTADYREGMTAFQEKRSPSFTGR
jgi:2-(1,2-epoxy-1,2-dihydrophenyl)acetyl-CoA isomerase